MKNLLKTTKNFFTTVSKHQQLVSLYDKAPQISSRAYCFPNTTIIGETTIDSNSFIGSNTIIRGDMNEAHIYENVFINENCSLSTLPKIQNSPLTATLKVRPRTIIGAGCTLTSCEIEEKVYIGENSVICEGALIRTGAFIGANSVVPPNREIPEFEVWSGNPVRFVKKVSRAEKTAHVYRIKELFKEVRRYGYEERAYGEGYLEVEEMEERKEREEREEF